jgi:hypothetical protein
MSTPNNVVQIREATGKVFIGGNGKVVCYQRTDTVDYQDPILAAIPILKGSTAGGSLTFNIGSYQEGTQVGNLSWSLQNAPIGVFIDKTTGVVVVNKGVAVMSTNGEIQVTVLGATNVPITKPLYMNIDAYDGTGTVWNANDTSSVLDMDGNPVTANGANISTWWTQDRTKRFWDPEQGGVDVSRSVSTVFCHQRLLRPSVDRQHPGPLQTSECYVPQ